MRPADVCLETHRRFGMPPWTSSASGRRSCGSSCLTRGTAVDNRQFPRPNVPSELPDAQAPTPHDHEQQERLLVDTQTGDPSPVPEVATRRLRIVSGMGVPLAKVDSRASGVRPGGVNPLLRGASTAEEGKARPPVVVCWQGNLIYHNVCIPENQPAQEDTTSFGHKSTCLAVCHEGPDHLLADVKTPAVRP